MKWLRKIILGIFASLAFSAPAFAGVYFNMILNFVPSPASAACQNYINSGALYIAVNPGLPDSSTGGGNARAIINSNSTVALQNINPGVTTLVPALNEDVYCSAQCALNNQNCWKVCPQVVQNFYNTQVPAYATNQGVIYVRCPTARIFQPGETY